MKALTILMISLMILSTTPAAVLSECRTTQPTLFFVDMETLVDAERVMAVSPAQASIMIINKIREGKIISVEAGLKVKKL